MASRKSKVLLRIELTPEQMEQIWQATGTEVSVVELTAEALEDRVAPYLVKSLDKSSPS